jgi:hypothetical protein
MMEKLINFAVVLVVAAAMTGQLPKAIKAVQIAQLQLIKESQASKWPKAMLLK